MRKLLILSAFLIFACSSDDEGNPCIYEPTLSTEAVTDITETSATLNGIIAIVSENCDVPNNAEQGFVYSTEIQPTLQDIQVNVNGTNISTTIEGLEPNTTYYVRSFLTNNLGDFYGDEISFTTIDGIINCDGNPIPTIVYGTQEWTVENACHITYRDGTPIPQVTDNDEWANLTTGAWCYYDNDPNKAKLYNWYAVIGIHDNDDSTPNKEFAPEGWHIPNDDEWTTLINYLINNGYESFQGETINALAKSMASATGWECDFSGTDTTYNSSGFNAFPIGHRFGWNPTTSPNGFEGFSLGEGQETYFWCYEVANWNGVTDLFYSTSLNIQCFYNSVQIGVSYKENGLSVRLVKN